MVRVHPTSGAKKTSTNAEPVAMFGGALSWLGVEALFLTPWPKDLRVGKLVRYAENDLLTYLDACRSVGAGGAR